MACDYEKMHKYGKIITFVCSGLLVGLGIGRFFNILDGMNPIDYIINIYMMYIYFNYILVS